MDWPIRTISFRECRRCKTKWCSEREELRPGDQINVIIVTIAYCPACAEDFGSELDRPTYRRAEKRNK